MADIDGRMASIIFGRLSAVEMQTQALGRALVARGVVAPADVFTFLGRIVEGPGEAAAAATRSNEEFCKSIRDADAARRAGQVDGMVDAWARDSEG